MVSYIVHDAATNIEGYLTDYDREHLEAAAAQGLVFLEVSEDGSRRIVSVDEIDEAKTFDKTLVPFISYEQWKTVMSPLAEMMAASMKPALTLLPNSVSTKVETPYERFLAALKDIDDVFNKEEGAQDGDAE